MPFSTESPYDILEVLPSASLNEILKAYQQALKKKKHPPPKLNQALNDLKNPGKRAEHDLLVFASFGDSTQVREMLANLPPAQYVPGELDPLPLTSAITALGAGEYTDDFKPVPDSPFQFQISTEYESLSAVMPLITIPT
jgi:curved DNA-binding protein CbpA